MVASAIFYAVVCWGCGSTERDRKRLNKLVRRASSVLDCPLETIEEVGERRMLTKLTSIIDNTSHPLHETVRSLSSSFSSRLLHPRCKKERYRRSFIPSAIRLFNSTTWCSTVMLLYNPFPSYLMQYFVYTSRQSTSYNILFTLLVIYLVQYSVFIVNSLVCKALLF